MPWLPLAPALGILGLLMAFGLYRYVVAQPAGSGLMVEISDSIHTGAMAFLRKEYSILVWFIVVVAILLSIGIGPFTALAFVSGTPGQGVVDLETQHLAEETLTLRRL